LPLQNERQHRLDEPIHRHAIGQMTEAAHEEHRKRLAASQTAFVPAGIDASAQASVEPGRQAGQE
jgi:hypothetical protein